MTTPGSKHLILGTAGHVDHGKTALIRALTGIECDTHREEKERGITIHLGFAHLTLTNGTRLGVIDVPGHRDFIHTMVGGASGIDFVLLVIAADSGPMPQTREHLQIMEILGITKGMVVITKTDLVEPDLLDLCELEIREFVAATFLRDAPVVKVSAKTGAGIPELRTAIETMAGAVSSRPADGVFRLYIDRSFSVSGFGTVVTGTVIGGTIRPEDTVYLLADKPTELRVRRIERHGAEVAEVQAGDRASLNLVGLDKSAFQRGMLLADRPLKATTLLDAALTIHAPKTELGIWSQAILHAGTDEKQVRVHLLNTNRLVTGEAALAQIHLATPSYLQHGDRFVLRNSSCDITIGGGEVIDAAPLHHRRRPQRLVAELELIARNKLHELVSLEIRKAQKPLTVAELAENLNLSRDAVTKVVDSGTLRGVGHFDSKEGTVLVSQVMLDTLRQGILSAARDYRIAHPLTTRGIDINELRGALHLEKRAAHDEVMRALLGQLVEKQKLRELDKTYLMFEDSGVVDPKSLKHLAIIEEYLRQCGMQTPLLSQIKLIAERERIGDKELRMILHHLVSTGKALKVEEDYLHHSVVDACRARLIEKLQTQPTGMKVSDFRDLIGGNRKICLLLLARFDEEGTTVRNGDYRFLAPAAK
jgi:selenocysteine-specific elongation factor